MQPVVVASEAELIALIRARVGELNTTFETVDHIAGLPERYLSMLLAPVRQKRMGAKSLPLVLQALALQIVRVEIAEDLGQAAKLRPRWKPRKRRAPLRVVAANRKQGELFDNTTEGQHGQERQERKAAADRRKM